MKCVVLIKKDVVLFKKRKLRGRSKQAPIHMSEFGLETLALLIGPKRAFHIALGTSTRIFL